MSIGKNIAKYRKAKKFTQEELGIKLGVTNQAVSKWESEVSMPDIMLLPEIVKVLDISLDDIYGITKEPEKVSAFAEKSPSLEDKSLQIVNQYYFGLSLDNVDKAILDHGTVKLCSLEKNAGNTWEVRFQLISTEENFPYILQQYIKPGILVDGYSVRTADGRIIHDDKPNKHYVCKEKVWEYKHTDKAYLRRMLQEQLDMGLIDEID